ncbi:hypothetical protein PR048_018986 [Dryococelus australis]|uniref:Uncharacterized protein n=1 Tax=Dryococelus australis TaxID=614101 RepID=A0ABQ9H2J8_9NEOP|nr:hypothetical protein PR048_018986 [Dryococelus australis]
MEPLPEHPFKIHLICMATKYRGVREIKCIRGDDMNIKLPSSRKRTSTQIAISEHIQDALPVATWRVEFKMEGNSGRNPLQWLQRGLKQIAFHFSSCWELRRQWTGILSALVHPQGCHNTNNNTGGRSIRIEISLAMSSLRFSTESSSGMLVNDCRWEGRDGVMVRLLASHQGEQGSIAPGLPRRFSRVEMMPDDAAGRRVFSGISSFVSTNERDINVLSVTISVAITMADGAEKNVTETLAVHVICCQGPFATTRLPRRRTAFDPRRGSPPPPPDFRIWKCCGTMQLVGEFPQGAPVPPRYLIPTGGVPYLASPSSALETPTVTSRPQISPLHFGWQRIKENSLMFSTVILSCKNYGSRFPSTRRHERSKASTRRTRNGSHVPQSGASHHAARASVSGLCRGTLRDTKQSLPFVDITLLDCVQGALGEGRGGRRSFQGEGNNVVKPRELRKLPRIHRTKLDWGSLGGATIFRVRADLPWHSRLVHHRSGVQEALGSSPGQGMGTSAQQGQPGSVPRRVARIFPTWEAWRTFPGFLGVLPFSRRLQSTAALSPPHFALSAAQSGALQLCLRLAAQTPATLSGSAGYIGDSSSARAKKTKARVNNAFVAECDFARCGREGMTADAGTHDGIRRECNAHSALHHIPSAAVILELQSAHPSGSQSGVQGIHLKNASATINGELATRRYARAHRINKPPPSRRFVVWGTGIVRKQV